MFGREIFRKTSIEKMTNPDDLDELLQVNSVHTWLLFGAISVVLAGMLVWGFMGTITKEVNGFGIIKTQELPRAVVTGFSGQVDSVFCRTGDKVSRDQKLMKIQVLEDKIYREIVSPFDGEITGLKVKEGSYVQTGSPLLELVKSYDSKNVIPEVIFFVSEKEIEKIKPGMTANLQLSKGGVPADYLSGKISFIADYPATKAVIQKYYPDEDISSRLNRNVFYEVRASLGGKETGMLKPDKNVLRSLNGLSCNVVITVDRQSPIKFLFK